MTTDEEKKDMIIRKLEESIMLREKIMEVELEVISKHKDLLDKMKGLSLDKCIELSEIIIESRCHDRDKKQ